ncbi:hypothetical protein NEOLI_000539 [Neolecta irregularis DAH-3]|uniref:Uncharacterized protein n=1 Tax=Neolecta irregularis (strain DAH-3) TaxID=1198029 RepID=A0A1U7LT29_NEOID|nr:hypothetical protein NEOLI_000539 [Neolecta irregularis DAH-3]|eukprot:OLL25817.1 hypothetical protein NEOLI_000539 [Neolecta irregularis DAH-3]
MAIIPDFNLLVLSLRIIPQTLSLLVLIVLFTFSQELVVPKRRDLTISIPESSPRVLETIISSRPNFSGAASHKSFDIARTPVLVLPNKSWATARKSLSVASLGTICHSGTSPSLSSTSKKCDCHPSTPSIPLLKSVKTTDPEVERSYSSKFAHYRKTFPGAVLSPLTGPPKVNAAYSHSLHRSWCSTDSVSKKGSDEFDLECLPSAKSSVFLKTSFKRSRKILNLMTCHMYDQTNHQSFSQSSKSLPSSFNLPNNFSSQKFETIQESSPEPSPVSDIDFSIETASMLLFPGSPCAKYLQCTLSDISVASSNFSRSSTHIWDKMKRISLENKNLETNFVGLIGGPPYLGALASRKFQQYVDSLSERSENALSSIAASTPFTSRERENQLHLKTGLWARPETLGTGSSLWTRTDHLWKMRRVSLIERSLVMFDRYSMRGSRTVVEPAEVLGTLWRPPSVATACHPTS